MNNPLHTGPRKSNPPKKPSMDDPLYPHIFIQLVGANGNGYAILNRTARAMRAAEIPTWRINEYLLAAMGGNFQELIQTTMKYVNCEEFLDEDFARMVTAQADGRIRDDYFMDDPTHYN